MKKSNILHTLYQRILPSILLGGVVFIVTWIISNFFISKTLSKNGGMTDEEKKLSEIAMDTTEASYDAANSVDINWVDVVCSEADEIPTINDVYLSITRSNAILMRSNGTFKLRLGQRSKLIDSNCAFSINDKLAISDISIKLRTEKSMISVATIKIVDTGVGGTRTKGFSIGGSRISFIDRNEISLPTYTLMHEIGHSWGLPHPFNVNGIPFGDLPQACADSNDRVYQMYDCPHNLRTCRTATQNEMVDNVMDYLPERCGRKFFFSPYQIKILEDFRSNLIETLK